MVVQVSGAEDSLYELRGKGIPVLSLGTLKPPSNNARVWDREVGGETVGKIWTRAGTFPRRSVGKMHEPRMVFH